MARPLRPVYWKPKYASRRMRERAFAKRQAAREDAVRRAGGPSLASRIKAWLAR